MIDNVEAAAFKAWLATMAVFGAALLVVFWWIAIEGLQRGYGWIGIFAAGMMTLGLFVGAAVWANEMRKK